MTVSKLYRFKYSITRFATLFLSICFFISILGCEAFVRKFTRKPKKEKMQEEQMILVPQEYPSLFASKEDEYRNYFLFWQSWQDELISALRYEKSRKKQMNCLDEAIKNISQIRSLLLEEKQKKLDIYLRELNDLKDALQKDIYTKAAYQYIFKAETIKKNILRDFSYPKVQDYLR